jgi:hypothetical protein
MSVGSPEPVVQHLPAVLAMASAEATASASAGVLGALGWPAWFLGSAVVLFGLAQVLAILRGRGRRVGALKGLDLDIEAIAQSDESRLAASSAPDARAEAPTLPEDAPEPETAAAPPDAQAEPMPPAAESPEVTTEAEAPVAPAEGPETPAQAGNAQASLCTPGGETAAPPPEPESPAPGAGDSVDPDAIEALLEQAETQIHEGLESMSGSALASSAVAEGGEPK